MKRYYYAFFLAFILISCKASEPELLIPDVAEIYEKIAQPSDPQLFAISIDADTLITTQHGVEVMIPAGVLVDASGNPVTGTVELKVEEAFTNAEIFVRPLSTVADGKLLASKGMLNIEATKNGTALQIKEGEIMTLIFPGDEADYEGYELFYGVETPEGVVEWVLDSSIMRNPRGRSFISPVFIGVTFTSSTYIDDTHSQKERNKQFDALLEVTNFPSFTNEDIEFFVSTNIQLHFRQMNDGHLHFQSILGSLSNIKKELLLERVNKMPEFKKDFGGSERKIKGFFTFTRDVLPEEIADLRFADFELSISQLGWTNCDVFLRLELATSEMTVTKPNDSTIVKLIFPEYKTMLTGWEGESDKLSFGIVPVGKQVNVVAVSPHGDDVRMSITKTTVTKELDALAPFEVVTKEEMTRRLNALN